MCIVCEHMLYEEHRRKEAAPFDPCPECKLMPSNDGSFCYHCYAVGNCVDECPECLGKPWSKEFLEAKAEIDAELGKDSDPESKHSIH